MAYIARHKLPRKINLQNFKLLDETEIPTTTSRDTDWLAFFNKIPRGKAAMLTEDDVSSSTLREAIRRLKAKNQLGTNFEMRTAKHEGKVVIYVVNSSEIKPIHAERLAARLLEPKIPTPEQLAQTIVSVAKSKPEFRAADLHQAIFGRVLKQPKERKNYVRFRNILKAALPQAEALMTRKLRGNKVGREIVYRIE